MGVDKQEAISYIAGKREEAMHRHCEDDSHGYWLWLEQRLDSIEHALHRMERKMDQRHQALLDGVNDVGAAVASLGDTMATGFTSIDASFQALIDMLGADATPEQIDAALATINTAKAAIAADIQKVADEVAKLVVPGGTTGPVEPPTG